MTIVRITMSVAACMVDLIVAHASMNVSTQSYIFAFYRKCGHIYKYMRISTVGPLPPAPHDYMPHAKAFGNKGNPITWTMVVTRQK